MFTQNFLTHTSLWHVCWLFTIESKITKKIKNFPSLNEIPWFFKIQKNLRFCAFFQGINPLREIPAQKSVGKKCLFSRAQQLCTAALVIIIRLPEEKVTDATSRRPRAWSAYARPRYAICANVLIAALSGEHGSSGSGSGRESRVRSRTYIRGPRTYITRACPTRAGAHTAYIRVIACRPWRLLAPRNCDAMRFPPRSVALVIDKRGATFLNRKRISLVTFIINMSFPFYMNYERYE